MPEDTRAGEADGKEASSAGLQSMTGFGRSADQFGALSWRWEVRSVNGRGLDVRLRLPSGFEELEPVVRESIGKSFARGNVNLTLSASAVETASRIRLNETALKDVLAASDTISERTGGAAPSVEALLNVRGVLEIVESDEDTPATNTALRAALLGDLAKAVGEVRQARLEEGRRLQAVILQKLEEIESLTGRIKSAPGRSVAAIKERLKTQVGKLLEASSTLDEARLHQEAALAATRADVEEELERLQSHIVAARDLVAKGGPVGRRLDFLCQEFNREANTLCSKASDKDISSLGVALKVAIDQMREQVQNVE